MTSEDISNPSDSPDSLDDFLNRTIEQFEELTTDFPELQFTLGQLRSLKAREDSSVPSPDAPTIDVKPGELEADEAEASAGGAGAASSDHISIPAGEKKYGVREEVGRGGMGKIVKIWDQELNRFLAMKLILDGTAGDPERVSRFVQEAQVMGQIDHPGIVPIHDFGVDSEGRVFFTMRLVKGQDFTEIIALGIEEKDGWNMSRLVGVLISVCQAVAFAHSRGIVHRDLKPANIMVGRFGEVYVMDWGLAKVKGRDEVVDLRLRENAQSSDLTVQTERRPEEDGSSDSPLIT
ncbi:MAG: serine/threonine-protein kinase, partial [Planctomycetota bacterium]|nr:serine/threonine-protein kinase [Planctomycetota bacterium]